MTLRVIALSCGVVLLAAACTVGSVPLSQQSTVAPPDGAYTHSGSGFKFPEAIQAFTRVEINKYDSAGNDISVGYNNQPPDLIAATVYVYPSSETTPKGSPPPRAEFTTVTSEIEQVNPHAAHLVDGARVTLGDAVGMKSTYRFEARFAGAQRPLQSDAYLFGLGSWLVEYRFTYPESSSDEAALRIRDFMDSLKWP